MGNYRPKPKKDISNILHARANLGSSSLSPNKEILANVIFHANVLEVYDVKGGSINKKWDYVIEEIDYKPDGNSYINNTVEGFIATKVTGEFIFALYSGEQDSPNKTAIYGKKIYKFDYEGSLLDVYLLDRDVINFEIIGNKIFAITHTPEPKIVLYEINI